MSRDRSADIHMKDGILRRGRKVGHADAKGRIRERDSRFKKGRELGYVDDKQRVRRRRGRLGQRGEIVAVIRGNAVYGRDTVLAAGPKLGYIDERGNVCQVDCLAFKGRVVGRARGADPESALGYFVLKFEDVATHVLVLEEKIRASEDQFAFLPRVRATRQLLPEVDALGDFDALFEKLDDLEELCVVGLGDHFTAEGGLGRLLTEGVTIDGLRGELVSLLGGERRTQVDALLYRARGAVDAISEGRIPTLADLEGPPEPEPEPEPGARARGWPPDALAGVARPPAHGAGAHRAGPHGPGRGAHRPGAAHHRQLPRDGRRDTAISQHHAAASARRAGRARGTGQRAAGRAHRRGPPGPWRGGAAPRRGARLAAQPGRQSAGVERRHQAHRPRR
ncbi:MAG: hypothetical protein IPL19_15675 [Sandaracinaceae bacterium]|nr:hypothetical protein [Sandaracinaceae bacterium]